MNVTFNDAAIKTVGVSEQAPYAHSIWFAIAFYTGP